MSTCVFITGTGTGVGKTVFASRLVRHLRESGTDTLAVKPICSGGRTDVENLREAQAHALTLDEINPWHFTKAVTPFVAAGGEPAKLEDVLAHIRAIRSRCDLLLIEGAGGVLSPLGEDFSSLELIRDLECRTVVVAPNRLGVINDVRLTMNALSTGTTSGTSVVLMNPPSPDASTPTNEAVLRELLPGVDLHPFPRLTDATTTPVREVLDRITRNLLRPH